jgi:hypothetical protein
MSRRLHHDVTRMRHAYRVEFRRRDVPECYRRWAIAEFGNSARIIWVSTRKRRDALLICDRSATSETHEYRVCRLCGRRMLGMAAQVRREQEMIAYLNGEKPGPCSKSCNVSGEAKS